MLTPSRFRLPAALLVPVLIAACTQTPIVESNAGLVAQRRLGAAPDSAGYQRKAPQDPNGIGKYYMGRQIAHVMGHDAAGWLERPDRQQEEGTDVLLRALNLRPTDVVADLGAGTGYFTFRMSPLVPQGRVLAVDIQPEMLARLRNASTERKVTNVEPVLGTVRSPNLPANSLDLVLIVDAYHEFDHPREMMRAVRNSLKPGGRVALVEYRAEDAKVPIKRIHRMSEEQARRELEAVGLKFVENNKSLPQQHLLIFQR
ncbi:class I SAM-dependent methyltransferase [Hymenobacter coalescens]